MKMLFKAIVASFCVFILSTVQAVPPGKTLEFTKSPMGKVTFSGDIHAKKELKCNDCHPKPFALKKGTAVIKLADHQEGKNFCFSCHNGKKAFATQNNCNKCHKP